MKNKISLRPKPFCLLLGYNFIFYFVLFAQAFVLHNAFNNGRWVCRRIRNSRTHLGRIQFVLYHYRFLNQLKCVCPSVRLPIWSRYLAYFYSICRSQYVKHFELTWFNSRTSLITPCLERVWSNILQYKCAHFIWL